MGRASRVCVPGLEVTCLEVLFFELCLLCMEVYLVIDCAILGGL